MVEPNPKVRSKFERGNLIIAIIILAIVIGVLVYYFYYSHSVTPAETQPITTTTEPMSSEEPVANQSNN